MKIAISLKNILKSLKEHSKTGEHEHLKNQKVHLLKEFLNWKTINSKLKKNSKTDLENLTLKLMLWDKKMKKWEKSKTIWKNWIHSLIKTKRCFENSLIMLELRLNILNSNLLTRNRSVFLSMMEAMKIYMQNSKMLK